MSVLYFPPPEREDDSGGLTEEDSQDGIKDPRVQISQAVVRVPATAFWDII